MVMDKSQNTWLNERTQRKRTQLYAAVHVNF